MDSRLFKELDGMMKLLSNVTDAFTSALFLSHKDEKLLRLKVYHSLGSSVIEGVKVGLGEGLIGWVASHNEPLNVSNFSQDTRNLLFYSQGEGIKSLLAIPLAIREGIGVLYVDSKRQYQFTHKVQKIVTGFAEQISFIIHRNKEVEEHNLNKLMEIKDLCYKISNTTKREEVINIFSTISKDLISFEGSALILKDGGRFLIQHKQGFIHLPNNNSIDMDLSLAGWILKKSKLIYLPNLRERENNKTYIFFPGEPKFLVKSFLGIPIEGMEEPIGAVVFVSRNVSNFTEFQKAAASIIVSQISSTLGLLQKK